MSMRFLILNTDYPQFVESLYASHPGLEVKPYAEQMEARFGTFFGLADFFSRALTEAGHEAETIIVNNDIAQRAWAAEAGMARPEPRGSALMDAARKVVDRSPRPVARVANRIGARLFGPRGVPFDAAILAEQIRRARPDVLINQAADGIPSRFLREIKPYVRLLVGLHASPMPNDRFDVYDLMLSSLPNYVAHFRNLGIRSEWLPFAFDPRILEHMPASAPSIPVSFVGTFSPIHATRNALLEYLAAHVDLQLWGNAVAPIPERSPMHGRYRGRAFGLEMYCILHRSRATVNFHIVDVAGPYANNMRLFEATGIGTLLVTDWKENLHTMFEPEREVVTFRSKEECREKIEHFLAHPAERDAIAAAGQQRVLREHTWAIRMQQLVEIIEPRL